MVAILEIILLERNTFNKCFILGLFTYLKQIELSIDRSLNNPWDDVICFFNDKPNPNVILKYFDKYYHVKNIKEYDIFYDQIKLSFSSKLIAIVLTKIFNKPFLFNKEINFLYYSIKEFELYLEKTNNPNINNLVDLRLKLRSCCDLLSVRLSKKVLERAQYIEHFNQNEKLNCLDFDSIVDEGWLIK